MIYWNMKDHDLFRQWLHKNHTLLRSYSPDEIARLAMACGFPIEVICPNVCDLVSHLKRLLTFWESPFISQWLALCNYERGVE